MKHHVGIPGIYVAGAIAVVAAQPCLAQDAAESAVILSGSGGTGAAARSIGEASAGAINNASGALNATRRARATSTRRSSSGAGRSASAGYSTGYTITAGNIDPLEYFRVPTFELGNGSQLRVSGTLNPVPPTTCVSGCG